MEEIVTKPWGNYCTLHIEKGFQVKRIQVNPGHRLSLQKHAQRAEKWTVVMGQGLATVDGREINAPVGTVIAIPLGATHRMANASHMLLVFIEVQIGEYLGEDDIERLEDDYDRS